MIEVRLGEFFLLGVLFIRFRGSQKGAGAGGLWRAKLTTGVSGLDNKKQVCRGMRSLGIVRR
jgi:hypothetical protein